MLSAIRLRPEVVDLDLSNSQFIGAIPEGQTARVSLWSQFEIRGERGQQFDDRIKNNVDHQRDASSKPISQPSKDEGTERAHHQGDGDGEGDLLDGSSEIMCSRNKDEGKEKEIERVQGPSEKASDESVALCAAQRFEQTQRFHVGSASCHVERSRDISE